MRGTARTRHALSLLGLALVAVASCDGGDPEDSSFVDVPGLAGASKSSPSVRLARRAFDGAPPVIPHDPIGGSGGAACLACHNEKGMEVPELGFAPAMPHGQTDGLSAISRCTQCHVYRRTDEVFVQSEFEPYRAAGEVAHVAYEGAPPVIPHRTFMRESCLSCHSGPAAREEIRTIHPERSNCHQCHVPTIVEDTFSR